MPQRDMDERLNIEGDPEDVIRALMGTDSDTTDDAEAGDEDERDPVTSQSRCSSGTR